MTRGLLITFEGGEGAGKSTQVGLLVERLRSAGHVVAETAEPGGTQVGRAIRQLLLDQVGQQLPPIAEALLFLADRNTHVEQVIAPRLADGQIVISDRFALSTLVYQGVVRGLDLDMLRTVNRWASLNATPAVTIVLDVDPAVGLARAARRGELNRIDREPLGFHQKVRQGFLDLVDGPHAVIDAHGSVDTVAKSVALAVEHALSARLAVPFGPELPLRPEWLAAYKAAVAAVGCPVCDRTSPCRCYVTKEEKVDKEAVGLAAVLQLVAASLREEKPS